MRPPSQPKQKVRNLRKDMVSKKACQSTDRPEISHALDRTNNGAESASELTSLKLRRRLLICSRRILPIKRCEMKTMRDNTFCEIWASLIRRKSDIFRLMSLARLTPNATAWPDVGGGDGSGTLTPRVELSNKTGRVTTPPGPPYEANISSPQMLAPLPEYIATESLPKTIFQPAQPGYDALFKDPRSKGLLEPLPIFSSMDLYPGHLNLTLDNYGTDGTTACPIAFSLILQNNARDYSIASLESKLLVGYQTAGREGDSCRILNRVLFAVLAEVSQGCGDKRVESSG